jgi:hypothetical protein
MSLIQALCCSAGSTDRAMALTLRLSNSGLSLAVRPSSVVQTGVKVGRVRKQHYPGIARPVMEADTADGGILLEVRRGIAKA